MSSNWETDSKGLAHVLSHVVPLYVMGDPRDFSSLPMVRSPLWERSTVFIWEQYPGGVGFSKKLFHIFPQVCRSAIDLIKDCQCKNGCPSCVGPTLEAGEFSKITAIKLLEHIISE